MSAASERMTRLSLESLKVVEGLNPDIEEDAMEEIDCGEWDGAIMDALDLAHDRKDLWPKFPEEVKAMTRDPEWPDLHRFAYMFDRSTKPKPSAPRVAFFMPKHHSSRSCPTAKASSKGRTVESGRSSCTKTGL